MNCGCAHVALYACRLDCEACVCRSMGQVEMPSSAGVIDTTPIYGSCESGAEAHGSARVVEILI